MKHLLWICLLAIGLPAFAQHPRILVLAERGEQHQPYVDTARIWLDRLAATEHFSVDYVENTASFTQESLAKYALVFQLNYPPYGWPETAKQAFKDYMESGKGGWIGVHHATLLGDFNGHTVWPWFQEFMGGIRFTSYIPTFVAAEVVVEDATHPVMKGVPARFSVAKEEWYTYDRSPRPNVRVLAAVDESTYQPASDRKMGDHPVVWTNEQIKGKNLYIFMGHDPNLFENASYKVLLTNALRWILRP